MKTTPPNATLTHNFTALYGRPPEVIASAPGRLEVIGNHTDYNAGLTLSCAVGFRCQAALSLLNEPTARLASTAFEKQLDSFPIGPPLAYAPHGHWADYVLGLVGALQERGHTVPGFALLIDSAVPRSAGVSSSAALEMAVLTGLIKLMRLNLSPIELARIGQWAESHVVGAQTGLLDQLTSICGKRDHLLHTDFRSLDYKTIPLPAGWVFVAIDSGVKHDLTQDYNDRRASCEAAAAAMGIETLRDASSDLLDKHRGNMADDAYRCATHILGENHRVLDAIDALAEGNMQRLGQLMFASHDSSRDHFQNSCSQLDAFVDFARQDARCLGARLSGGGFGGISIHLVHMDNAVAYSEDIRQHLSSENDTRVWSAVCQIDNGATMMP